MTISNIRHHPYNFEHALQLMGDTSPPPPPTTPRNQPTRYFTWLVFMHAKWVPFDADNQAKLEQTLNLGGTFVDIRDSHFPDVKRVRCFPKSNYLSYLGVKYRLSRVMQPDAWIEPPDHDESPSTQSSSFSSSIDDDDNSSYFSRLPQPPAPFLSNNSSGSDYHPQSIATSMFSYPGYPS